MFLDSPCGGVVKPGDLNVEVESCDHTLFAGLTVAEGHTYADVSNPTRRLINNNNSQKKMNIDKIEQSEISICTHALHSAQQSASHPFSKDVPKERAPTTCLPKRRVRARALRQMET